eukprot:868-Heterococcus_DN1.PRE.4
MDVSNCTCVAGAAAAMMYGDFLTIKFESGGALFAPDFRIMLWRASLHTLNGVSKRSEQRK